MTFLKLSELYLVPCQIKDEDMIFDIENRFKFSLYTIFKCRFYNVKLLISLIKS